MRIPVLRPIVRAVLAAVMAAFVLAPALQAQEGASELRPGDAVRIAVWRMPELSGEFEIAGDGTIAHPLYRTVRATGAGQEELERRVRERLLQIETNPQFVVEPLFRVSVGGEVRQPNLYSLRPEVTVAQAVARAGGLSERGRLDRVILVRDGSRSTLNLVDPASRDGEIPVRSGDQIYVERRRDVFRELVAPVASVVAAVASVYRALSN